MSKLLNLTIITAYIYSITILTYYGYVSFFNIPSSFVSASIQGNVIYLFFLFGILKAVTGLMAWWMWVIFGFLMAIIAFIYYCNTWYSLIIKLLIAVPFILFLISSYNFGGFLAANSKNFYILSSDCQSVGSDNSYIIPAMSETEAVLIPIDENKKMKGGFLIKNMAELSCKMEMREIGKITK